MQSKYFEVYDQDNKAVQDAYALLTANVHFSSSKENIKTITLTSWTPKVGKTTVAINLAISLARSGWKTLLVDADIRKPGTYKRLNNQETMGLLDIIEGNIYLLDVLSSTNIPNLTYLPCGNDDYNPIELMCSPKFSELMTGIRKDYDFVLFDTPALSSVIDGALVASITDGVILVAQMGTTKVTALHSAKEQLEKANANILGVVINKVKKRDYIKYVESYDYFFDTKHFKNKKNSPKNNLSDPFI